MRAYIQFIIRNRLIVLITVMLLTFLFGGIASTGVYSSSIAKLFFGEDHPGYQRYRKRIREFANDEMVIVVYRDPALFSPASLNRLQTAVDTIDAMPEIRRVDSLLNAQRIYGKDDTLYIDRYSARARKKPGKTDQILKDILNDEMYRGLLVSDDGQHAAVMVELEPVDELAGETVPPLVNRIMKAFLDSGFQPDNLHRVGFTSTMADVVKQTDFNIKTLFPIGCVILLIIVYLMFQRLWPVFITMGVSFIGVIWTFGFSVILDRHISIFISVTPVVIMIVATSDVIHLCSAYLLELARGKSKDDAILASATEVGIACFWTSVTTFVGFVSLSFVPIPVFRQMGVVLGFGVAVSLLLAMTLTPVLFVYMRQPASQTYDASRAQRLLGKVLDSLLSFIIRRPVHVTAVFLLVFILAIIGAMRITIDTDFYKRFSENSRTRQDEQYYHRHFAGSNFLEVFIDTPQSDGIIDAQVFSRYSDFQHAVEALDEVDDALSLINLIESIDREMNPSYSPGQTSTWTRPLLAQYLLLFESSGGEDLDRMIDFGRKTARMNVRLAENGTQFTYASGRKIEALADEILGDHAKVEVTGMMFLLGGFVDDVISGQKRGLLFAFSTILIMMIYVFRSVSTGLWSMLPNALPLIVLGGYIGFFWQVVDSDTIVIAMAAVGIGVDDTIHFLSRLRFESMHTRDPGKALQQAFHFSGRAMVTTTVILSAGFMPMALSDYFTVGIFGTLLPMTLVVALMGDILLAPALVRLGAIRFGGISKSSFGH